jgi:bifunctional non-homologous end joining protein LigD
LDEGFYELADADGRDKIAQDEELRKGIHAGKLHVVLHAKKLKGEYALVKTHGRAENAWLIFKIKDKYVSKEDITLKDKSVISKKTLTQLEKTTTNFYQAKRVMESGRRAKFPVKLSPMLATMVDKPFDKEGWQYEIKWDGYRVVAFCNKIKVELRIG